MRRIRCTRAVLLTILLIAASRLWQYHGQKYTSRSFVVYEAPDLLYLLEANTSQCSTNYTHKTELPIDDSERLLDIRKFHFRMNPPRCNGSRVLLALVHSAPRNRHKRQIIRNTWGSVLKGSLFFMIGGVHSTLAQASLEVENGIYKDLVQGSFMDTYRRLTYKHVMSLKWALYFCPEAKYVVKTDDDTFVNAPLLLRVLAEGRAACGLQKLMLCHVKERCKVIRKRSKWAVKRSEFPNYFYPNYCLGMAILYSRDMVHDLYLEAQRTRYFWIDDVFVTGIVARKLNKTHHHANRVLLNLKQNAVDRSLVCAQSDLRKFVFSLHDMDRKEMGVLWWYVQHCLTA